MATNNTNIGSTEAAAVLGVTRSTVNRWAQIGLLKPIAKLNGVTGARIFKRADIERVKRNLELNAR